jgi:hypothetical protein
MNLLHAIFQAIFDLLVEDGSIALGTVGALVATGIWEALTNANPELANRGGLLLFVLLMALLLGNVYRAGRSAARKRVQD